MKFEYELAKTLIFGVQEKRLQSVRLQTAFWGIFLASFGLFFGGALMGGYHQTFERAILDFNSHIIVKMRDGYMAPFQAQQIETEIQSLAVEFPLQETPFVYWEGLVTTDDGIQSIVLKGLDFKKLKTLYPFDFKDRDISNLKSNPLAYVGQNLLNKNLKINKGLFSILHLQNGQLQTQAMTLAGTFQTGIEPYDSEFVLMDLNDLHTLFVEDDLKPVLGFEIRLQNMKQIKVLSQKLHIRFEDDLEIKTWDELNFSLLDGLKLEKTTFTVVGICILLIACLNIFGFNLMFFLQNHETFRILTYLGYAKTRIRKLLMGISLFVGLSASGAACLLAGLGVLFLNVGPGLTLNIENLPPVRILALWNWDFVGLFFVTTILVSLFASFVASRAILKS